MSSGVLSHEAMREATFERRTFLRQPAEPSAAADGGPAVLTPSPASQLCQTMAFGYSLFFPGHAVRAPVLAEALRRLTAELPVLAGRARLAPRSWPLGRALGDARVALDGAGAELVEAAAPAARLGDLGPAAWTVGTRGRRLADFPVPWYAEPMDAARLLAGREPLLKLKLAALADGQVVSATVSHLVADAGRAVRLLERLAEHYRAAARGGAARGPPLRARAALETAAGYAAALAAGPGPWRPAPLDHALTPRQWLAAPAALARHARGRHDMHLLHLPAPAVAALKRAAAGAGGGADASAAAAAGAAVTTMDAVQALLATATAHLRRRPLVPAAPAELTVNVDLLHRGAPLADAAALRQHVGNAVHILHVPGLRAADAAPGGGEPALAAYAAQPPEKQAADYAGALRANARLIRRAVAGFRAEPRAALRALARQAAMVAVPAARLGAAFVVKGADLKTASTTAVTAFPFDGVDFGGGPARCVQINYQPRFDWWSIVQAAPPGALPGGGVLASVVLAEGLGPALAASPVLAALAPGARVLLARDDPPGDGGGGGFVDVVAAARAAGGAAPPAAARAAAAAAAGRGADERALGNAGVHRAYESARLAKDGGAPPGRSDSAWEAPAWAPPRGAGS